MVKNSPVANSASQFKSLRNLRALMNLWTIPYLSILWPRNMRFLNCSKHLLCLFLILKLFLDVGGSSYFGLRVSSNYSVQSPEMSDDVEEVIPTLPLVTEENLRFNLRNVQGNLGRVDDKAMVVAKKGNLEDQRNKGGRVVKDLHKQSINLLVKWWWKLESSNGLWQDLVKGKYLKKGSVATAKNKFGDSPVWKSLMRVKPYYINPSDCDPVNLLGVARTL